MDSLVAGAIDRAAFFVEIMWVPTMYVFLCIGYQLAAAIRGRNKKEDNDG